jgi:acyl-CoA synthetase (AMP-forming)/AMP-acid ligase II
MSQPASPPFTLDGLFARLATARPDAACLSYAGETTSYAELDRRARRVAAALTGDGVQEGERVAIIARNSAVFFELLLGCARAGVIFVPINWRLAPREVAAIVADCAPRMIFLGASESALLTETPAGTRSLMLDADYAAWRDAGGEHANPSRASIERVLALLYTSGTTGRPKGVMITHRNLSYTERMAREVWSFTETSVNVVAMPLFHIGGLGYGLMAMTQGGHTVLLPTPEPAAVLASIRRYGGTHGFFVPTVLKMLIDAAAGDRQGLTSLQRIVYGGAPITQTLLAEAIELFGCGFSHAYGLTETAGTVITLAPDEHRSERLRSCGRPVPWVDIRVVDPRRGEEVPAGDVGELQVRSPIVSPGYWGKPTETSESRDAGGWLRTGDAAIRDADGFVYICDRYKDMIVTGGENVFSAEVENVLARHPAVAEVAVIAAPHPRWGETVKAVVVVKAAMSVEAADLIRFAREQLAHYKCPTLVDWVESLPKNASGKVLKHELRDRTS